MKKYILHISIMVLMTACGRDAVGREIQISTSDTNKTSIISDREGSVHEPYFHQQWYLDKNTTFYKAHHIDNNASIHFGNTYQYTGKGIKIAIIDNGLDTTHPELNNSIIATYDLSSKTANVAHNTNKEHHGTSITGIIASNGISIKGIANESQIIFLKYQEGMSDSQTIELLLKAQEYGADIINCSWGTYDVSESVKEVIQDLATNGREGKGIFIVFAIGNDTKDMGNDESAIPEVIAVGASDKENLRAWYSNHGENIDLLAPGGDFDLGIATLDPIGENGIATLTEDYLLSTDQESFIGTSASAPIVSSVIALMLEKKPSMNRIEFIEILKKQSDKIGTLDYVDGWNQYYGYGKINVKKFLDNLK